MLFGLQLTIEIKLPSHDEESRDSMDGSTKEGEARGSLTSLYEDSSGAEDDTDDDNDWESGKSRLLSSTNEDSQVPPNESKSNRQSDSSTEEKIYPKSKKQSGSSISSSISLISSKVSSCSCENSCRHSECNQGCPRRASREGTGENAKHSSSATSSSNATPTAKFVSKKNDKSQNSNHSSCLALSSSYNSRVVRSKSATNVFSVSESLSVVNIEGINKSRSGTLLTTREIIDLPLAVSDVGPSSSTIDIASSTADAKVTNLKGSAGFFRYLTKKFSYRK